MLILCCPTKAPLGVQMSDRRMSVRCDRQLSCFAMLIQLILYLFPYEGSLCLDWRRGTNGTGWGLFEGWVCSCLLHLSQMVRSISFMKVKVTFSIDIHKTPEIRQRGKLDSLYPVDYSNIIEIGGPFWKDNNNSRNMMLFFRQCWWNLSFLFQGFLDCFNIDTKKHRIIKGPKQAQFGYTVQQHVAAGGEKW